jgi:hypothetical protein
MPLNLYWKQRIIQLYLESVRSYGEVVRMLRDEGKIVWSVVRLFGVWSESTRSMGCLAVCQDPGDNPR